MLLFILTCRSLTRGCFPRRRCGRPEPTPALLILIEDALSYLTLAELRRLKLMLTILSRGAALGGLCLVHLVLLIGFQTSKEVEKCVIGLIFLELDIANVCILK